MEKKVADLAKELKEDISDKFDKKPDRDVEKASVPMPGDIIHLDAGQKDALQPLIDDLAVAFDGVRTAHWLHHKAKTNMFEVVRAMIPDLDRFEFVLNGEKGSIIIKKFMKN